MATPAKFKEANHNWIKPESMAEDECGSLPAFIDPEQPISISCWKMTWKERLKVLFTGRVWIGILTNRQPPIWINGNRPFEPTGSK